MNELLTLTAAELGERIAARQISSEEVTQAHLDRISEVDGDIHAFRLSTLLVALMPALQMASISVRWRGCRWLLRIFSARKGSPLQRPPRCSKGGSPRTTPLSSPAVRMPEW